MHFLPIAMSNDDPRPLISHMSPTYLTARREHLHSAPAPDAELVAVLAHLVEIEIDLTAACEAAREVAEDPALIVSCQRAATEHRAHVDVLSDHLRALGAAPPEEDDVFPTLIPHSAEEIRDLFRDEDIVRCLAEDRSFACRRYRSALNREDLPADTRLVLARELEALREGRGAGVP